MRNGVAWRGVLGPQWPSKCAHCAQPPLHGASPQLCSPWSRTPSTCCARVGPCGALMRLYAQWRGLVWRAWPAAAFKVCPLRASHPHCALRGTSPQLCTPCLRTPSACCACSGPSGALMRQPSQLQGPTCRGGPAAAPRVCPLRIRPPPPVPSAAPRCASVLPVCARPAPTVHLVGYRGP